MLAVKTAFISLPDEPKNLKVLGTTGGSATLSWDAPLDFGGTDISSYEINFFAGYDTSTKFKQLISNASSKATTLTAKASGLNATTTYGFSVVPVNDISTCVDASVFASYAVVYATTGSISAPEVPYDLNVSLSTAGMQVISWSPTTDRGGDPIVRYVLFSDTDTTLYSGTQTTFMRGSLQPNTMYGYAVLASNSAGTSMRSPVIFRKTSTFVTVPGTATNLIRLASTGGSIVFTWTAPLDLGGDVLLGYRIFRNGAQLPFLGLLYYQSTTYTDANDLVAEQEYLYVVQAVNPSGAAVKSEALTARTTVATVPAVPVGTSVAAVGGSLTLSWLKPNDTGGVPLESFNVTIAKGGALVFEKLTLDTLVLYYGIEANTNYTISVTAKNKIGYGPVVVRLVRNGNATRPQAPRPPELVSFSSQSVVLALRGPLDSGGANITLLKLYQDSVLVRSIETSGYYQVALGSLFASKVYSFSATATSIPGLGESDRSPAIQVTTANPTMPSVVYDLTLDKRTFGSLLFKWKGPDDIGGENVIYEVEYSEKLNSVTAATLITSFQNVTIDGLASSTAYIVRVRAANSAGKSAWTAAVQGDTDIAQRGAIVLRTTATTLFENATSVAFQLVRVDGKSSTITCIYDISPSSTAVAGVNFVLPDEAARRFAFLDGETQKAFSIQLLNDDTYALMPLELALKVIDTTPNRSDVVLSSTASIFIADDGDAGWIDFANTTLSVREDVGVLDVPLQRVRGKSSLTSVRVFEYIDEQLTTATTPVDFSIVTPVVAFADGETWQFAKVRIQNNSVYDFPFKQFALSVKQESGGGQIGPATIVWVTILDDGDTSPPGLVRDLTPTESTGGLIKLKWTPPVNLGGASLWITKYNLSISTDDGTRFALSKDNATEYSFGRLQALTRYEFRVAALNRVGTGAAGTAVYETTTNYSRPGAVPALTLVDTTGGLMTIVVSDPLDFGGASNLTYMVYLAIAREADFKVRFVLTVVLVIPTV